MRIAASLALLLLLSAAPANDAQRGMAALHAIDARVATVGHRLAVAGAEFCPDAVRRPGFTVQALAQYRPATRRDARVLFGLGDRPAVLAVAKGSGADRAGLRDGDEILAIDGAATAAATPAKADYAPVAAAEEQIEAALAHGPLLLTVSRDGRPISLSIGGDRGCRSRFQAVPETSLNASADGIYVQLSTRIAELAARDDELALVIAHELSHNILKHRAVLDAAGVSRGLLRSIGKNRTRIRATEVEADRLALYLMARAGYDIGVAPAFWDRFGSMTDYGIFADGTHAGRRERVDTAAREIAIIRGQQARGEKPTPH